MVSFNYDDEEQIPGAITANKHGVTIFDLPDHFMISVFKFFTLTQRLLQISLVCTKWSSLLKEGSLWTEIDLRKYNKSLSLEDLKNLIKRYGCESTKSLMLYGVFNQDSLAKKIENFKINQDNNNIIKKSSLAHQEKIFYLDEHFINEILALNCPNINAISLEYLDLSDLNIAMFLSLKKLKSLNIKWCNINSENWFECSANEIKHENDLKDFFLIKTGTQTHENIIQISNLMPNLKILSISQANSTLKNNSVDVIVEKLVNLEKLELINTQLDDDAILKICNSTELKRSLTHLNVSMSSSITNNCLLAIGNLDNIKSLYLTSCFGISNFNLLLNLVKLEYLNVNNTSIDKEHIRNVLIPMLPNCEIEYGHEKILNEKLTWTINGSRNSVCSF